MASSNPDFNRQSSESEDEETAFFPSYEVSLV